MKRMLAPLGILTILLAFGPAWSARKLNVPDPSTTMTSYGTIAAVNTGAKTVTVKVDGENGTMHRMTFELTSTSKIVRAERPVALSKLSTGEHVSVTYKKHGRKNLVVNIGVVTTS